MRRRQVSVPAAAFVPYVQNCNSLPGLAEIPVRYRNPTNFTVNLQLFQGQIALLENERFYHVVKADAVMDTKAMEE